MRPLEVTVEERRFPAIDGLSTTPTLTRNEPGYDEDAKLYLAFESGEFGDIQLTPTKAEAEAALSRLFHPAREFPFATPAARAVWLAAMLTAVVRGQLRTCPIFVFDAPAKGSGKTKLAEMIGLLALGVQPPAASWGENEEENSKTLFSILRGGDPAVLFDNVEAEIRNTDLCRVLTAPSVTGRILGVSEMVTLGTRTIFLFTGNNIQISGDMTRRTMICRIDAGVEHPEDRAFDFDPVRFVEENRAQLVADALIVLRAYSAARRPVSLPRYNSFDDWDLVRGALVWLGENDPRETIEALRANDTKREEKADLFIALLKEFGLGTPFMARDLDDECGEGKYALKRTITMFLGRPDFSARSAGKLLARHREQPFMGVVLRSRQNSTKQTEWWFEGAPEAELLEAMRPDPIDEVPY